MARTLSQILIDANAFLDLDAALPTGDDLTVRINYAQQAVREWADSYRWQELKVPNYAPTVNSSSITLPNFKELLAPPQVMIGDRVWREYPQILPEDRFSKDPADYYCYIQGNQSEGFLAVFNNLASGASLSIAYQRQPSNMATLTDTCEVPDADFVKMKVISYVLQSRSDERFPVIEAEAQRLLRNMTGRSQIQVPGGVPQVRRSGSANWSMGKSRG